MSQALRITTLALLIGLAIYTATALVLWQLCPADWSSRSQAGSVTVLASVALFAAVIGGMES